MSSSCFVWMKRRDGTHAALLGSGLRDLSSFKEDCGASVMSAGARSDPEGGGAS